MQLEIACVIVIKFWIGRMLSDSFRINAIPESVLGQKIVALVSLKTICN